MVFCGESIITEISVYVSFYMSEFIIQSTIKKGLKILFSCIAGNYETPSEDTYYTG